MVLQSARKLFHHRGLPGTADGGIADRDDPARRMMFAQKPMPVEPEPRLHAADEKPAQAVENPAQREGAFAVAALENDVDRELFEGFEPAAHLRKEEG